MEAGKIVDTLVDSLAKEIEEDCLQSADDERNMEIVSDTVTPVVVSGSGSKVQHVVGDDMETS